jgi:hypothetical protein
MTVYLKWLSDTPNVIITTPRIFAALGGIFMGFTLIPEFYCDEGWMYGIDDTKL